MGLKKGQTNNPNGRPPKSQALSDIIREKLEEEHDIIGKDGKKRKVKLKRIFVEKLLQLAMGGDLQAYKLAMNYCDGMPVQKNINENIEIESPLADEIKKMREK